MKVNLIVGGQAIVRQAEDLVKAIEEARDGWQDSYANLNYQIQGWRSALTKRRGAMASCHTRKWRREAQALKVVSMAVDKAAVGVQGKYRLQLQIAEGLDPNRQAPPIPNKDYLLRFVSG